MKEYIHLRSAQILMDYCCSFLLRLCRKPWRRVGIAVLVAVSLAMVMAAPVLAAEVRGGPTLDIREDDVVDDDLFVFGGAVVIDGVVNGELFTAGGSVTVNGTVNGNVTAVGGTIIINGKVTRAVRVASGLLKLNSEVGGDVMLLSRDMEMTDTASVGGDILLYGEDAYLGGTIAGDIKGTAGEVNISGLVKGNINLDVDALIFTPKANVEGNVDYTCEEEADIQAGARIEGSVAQKVPEVVVEEVSRVSQVFSSVRGEVMSFLAAFVLGLVIIAAFHRMVWTASAAMRRKPGPSFGWGILLLVAVPAATIAAGITIAGIPLALIITVLYMIAIYSSQVLVGLVLGQWLLGKPAEGESKGAMIGALAFGLAIIVTLRSLPVPYINLVIWLITIVFGLGTLAVALWESRGENRESDG